jgi:NCS1 family nucleobase:cation symporter-1
LELEENVTDEHVAAGNQRFKIEEHGYEFVPESERTMSVRDLGFFWTATNLYLFNFAIGAIAFSFGLPLWLTLIAVTVGNGCYALVALGSIAGARSGVPTLTITRAAFGHEANRLNCLFSWLLGVAFEVVNVVFGVFAVVALFAFMGWDDPGTAGKLIGLVVVYASSVAVAMLGHATLVYFQRVFAVVLGVAMVLVAAYALPGVDFAAAGQAGVSGGERAGLFLLAAGIVAAAGLAYMQIPSDYSRYLPTRTPGRSVFWTVLATAGGMALFLTLMGALLASRADLSDPVAGVEPLIPGWLYALFVISVIGGSVSNNIITLYSSAFAVQTIGLKLRRWQATALDAAVASVVLVYVLFINDNLLSILNDFIAITVVWIAPFGAIWVTDAVLRRFTYDAADLHAGRGGRFYGRGGINWNGMGALAAGAVAALLTMNAPVFQGPLSDALLAGGDLAWLAGPVLGALVYALLAAPGLHRERLGAAAAATTAGGPADRAMVKG